MFAPREGNDRLPWCSHIALSPKSPSDPESVQPPEAILAKFAASGQGGGFSIHVSYYATG